MLNCTATEKSRWFNISYLEIDFWVLNSEVCEGFSSFATVQIKWLKLSSAESFQETFACVSLLVEKFMVLLKPPGLIAVAFSDVNKKKVASDKIVDLGTGHIYI